MKNKYPLHKTKKDVFLDQLLDPASPHNNIGGYIKLKGASNNKVLISILTSMPSVFDAFKMRFDLSDFDLNLYYSKNDNVSNITKLDFTFSDNPKKEAELWVQNQFNIPFKLTKNRAPYELALLTISKNEVWLFAKCHHLVMDGFSFTIWANYISQEYRNYGSADYSKITFKPYLDYIKSANEVDLKNEYLKDNLYWKDRIQGIPEGVFQKKVHLEKLLKKRSGHFELQIDDELNAKIKSIRKKTNASIQQITICAFLIYLGRTTSQNDFVFGLPVHRRDLSTDRDVIGMLSGNSLFKGVYEPEKNLYEFIKKLVLNQLEDYKHPCLVLSELNKSLNYNSANGPLFEIAIHYAYLNFHLDFGAEIDSSICDLTSAYEKTPMRFWWKDYGSSQALRLQVDFSFNFFNEDEARLITDRILFIINQFDKSLNKNLQEIRIFPNWELDFIKSNNLTSTKFSSDQGIISLFEKSVQQYPDKIAVTYGDKEISYSELDRLANKIACSLIKQKIKSNSVVPIFIDRSFELIASILGVLKAGVAYAPLDTVYPKFRLNTILKDLNPKCLLTTSKNSKRIQALKIKTIILVDDELTSSPGPLNQKVGGHLAGPDDLAYVIYTSGSTGRPKGVMLSHQALCNLINWHEGEYGEMHLGRTLQFTSIGFDVSFQEIFSTLCFGKQLFLIGEDSRKDLNAFVDLLNEHKIDNIFIPYQFLNSLAHYCNEFSRYPNFLKTIFTAGEQVSLNEDIKKFLEITGTRLINQYGPSETHVVSSYTIEIEDFESNPMPPIGKPISNSQLYVLSPTNEICGIDILGELCVGGAQLGLGYWKNDLLNKKRFIARSEIKGDIKSSILFKTGDLCKISKNGNIYFFGRNDLQVKIRGHRVELREVEKVVNGYDFIDKALVVSRQKTNDFKYLVAYIISKEGYTESELLTYMKSILPEYMIPAIFIEISVFPTNKNGKINYDLLPAVSLETKHVILPETPVEEEILKIWKLLFVNKEISTNDNFFVLGGHSLLAIKMLIEIKRRLKVALEMKDLFENPTIKEIGLLLDGQVLYNNKEKITNLVIQDMIPASFNQEELWNLDKAHGSLPFIMKAVVKIDGEINLDCLELSFKNLLVKHESLKTVLFEQDNNLFQMLLDEENWVLEVRKKVRDASKEFDLFFHSNFDLAIDYPIRALIIKKAQNLYDLAIMVHHIACDGWSIPILVKELNYFYLNNLNSTQAITKRLPYNYVEYSVLQRNAQKGINSELRFWESYLQGLKPTSLYKDYTQKKKTYFGKADFVATTLSSEMLEGLLRISNKAESTLFQLLLAAFKILLYKYTNSTDVSLLTPVANRDNEHTVNLIGYFVNTIILRSNINPDWRFSEYLDEIITNTLNAFKNQSLPFLKIVDIALEKVEKGSNPIPKIKFVLHNQPEPEAFSFGKDISSELYLPPQDWTQIDLSMDISQIPDGLYLKLTFNRGLYKKERIEYMLGHYITILTEIIKNPLCKIRNYNIITSEEFNKIIYGFRGIENIDLPITNVVDLFEKIIIEQPNETAIWDEGKTINYYDLNRKANLLANYLICRGQEKEAIVAVCMDRSILAVITFFAILKAGSAYLPIDKKYPPERIAFMLDDSKSKILITDKNHELGFEKPAKLEIIELDDDWLLKQKKSPNNPSVTIGSNDLAYIIYTSGTTGKPKGVMIEHKGIVNLVTTQKKPLGLRKNLKNLQFASFGFDASIYEIFCSLLTGGQLFICPKKIIRDNKKFVDFLRKNNIELATLPPSYQAVLCDEKLPLTTLVSAGEKINIGVAKKFISQGIRLVNAYGPTENTVCTSISLSPIVHNSRSTIGQPLPNVEIYLLNSNLKPVAIGMVGEIYIGGHSLARGYLNRPELNKEYFIQNPLKSHLKEKIYRTGDLGRWLTDGNIEFLGRIDEQVKIKGRRIEILEVENTLEQCEFVQSAAVITKLNANENFELVAFVVAIERDINVELIRGDLEKKLPEFMVPQEIKKLKELPVTTNGKVDKKRLSDLVAKHGKTSKNNSYNDKLAQVILKAWCETLEVDSAKKSDNFFKTGGDSLKVIKMVSLINKNLNVEIDVEKVYETESLGSLIDFVGTNVISSEQERSYKRKLTERIMKSQPDFINKLDNVSEIELIIPATDIQIGMIYASKLELESSVYHDQMLLRNFGIIDTNILIKALSILVAKHQILRTCFRLDLSDLPVLLIYKEGNIDLETLEVVPKDEAHINLFLQNLLKKRRKSPFDLGEHSPWRLVVIKLENTDLLLFECHHALLDGWSVASFNAELIELYKKLERGDAMLQSIPLKSNLLDYYIEYQRKRELKQDFSFWTKQFSSHEKNDFFSNNEIYERKIRTYDKDFFQALELKCKKHSLSLKSIFLGSFIYALSLLNYRKDITIGLVSNLRYPIEDGDKLLGCFLNTLPFRYVSAEESDSWIMFFGSIDKKLNETYSHRENSLIEIAKACGINESVNPFFDVIFNFVDFHIYEDTLANDGLLDTREKAIGYAATNTFFDCTVSLTNEELNIVYILRRSFSSNISINEFEVFFDNILNCFISKPTTLVNRYDIIPREELNLVLSDFNNAMRNNIFSDSKTVIDFFMDQVKRTPESVAVKCEQQEISYTELYQKSVIISRHLGENGIQLNDAVGICTDRSVEMVVGILGILISGGSFVPIDPHYPKKRKRLIFNDSKCKALLCKSSLKQNIVSSKFKALFYIDNLLKQQTACKPPFKNSLPRLDTNAYIMYTSGSTGNPKGVIIQHKALVNRLLWAQDEFKLSNQDTILQKTTYCFDVSIAEIIWPLMFGAKLFLGRSDDVNDPTYLNTVINNKEITVIHFVPSMLENFMLNTNKLDSDVLRLIMCSGEALEKYHLKLINDKINTAKVYNLYGPTEAAIDVTFWECPSDYDDCREVFIGKPNFNIKIFILNEACGVVPIGVVGELCIGGVQLSKGYINSPVSNLNQFVNFKHIDGTVERIYKTGDLAFWDSSGNIKYVGRNDHQIKIRGQRVELSEIEHKIKESGEAKQCVVTMRKQKDFLPKLVAFIVATESYDESRLKDFLRRTLPNFMIPVLFIELNEIPLMINGKIDLKKLEKINLQKYSDTNGGVKVAPKTDLEKTLVDIWKKLLDKQYIGVNDNFFELGGDSIISMQLVHKLNTNGLNYTTRDIYDNPTIIKLAKLILEKKQGQVELLKNKQLPVGGFKLSPIQAKLLSFNLKSVNNYCQFISLSIKKSISQNNIVNALKILGEHHDSLRLRFKVKQDNWNQLYGDSSILPRIEIMQNTNDNYEFYINEVVSNEIKTININEGDLLRTILIQTPIDLDNNFLVLIAHHLIIDGVSWRILLEDLVLLLESKEINKETLGLKTSTYQEWCQQLYKYSRTQGLLRQKEYWKDILRKYKPLSSNKPASSGDTANIDIMVKKITYDNFSHLVNIISMIYDISFYELLVSELVICICNFYKRDSAIITLEGHGRSEIFGDKINITRTVGWFTDLYPLHFEFKKGTGKIDIAKDVRQKINRTPDNGIGFGVLRYLIKEKALTQTEFSNIIFNYLGNIDLLSKSNNVISEVHDFKMKSENIYYETTDDLVLDCYVKNNSLNMSWTYNSNRFTKSEILTLSSLYSSSIQEFIIDCTKVYEKHHNKYNLKSKILSKSIKVEDLKNITLDDEGEFFLEI